MHNIICYNTPNAKMAARLIFFCLNLNKPNQPRSPVQNSKEYLISSEASWANFNLNKRILIWQPFLHWVYNASPFAKKDTV